MEERVIKLAADFPDRMERQQRPPSRSHDPFTGASGSSYQQDNRSMDGDGEGDLRFRLMEKKSSEENKERMNADPNFVPQGRYYYEVILMRTISLYISLYRLHCLINSTIIVKGS